jgi:2-keto-4-pentenoate hydratase
MSRITISVVVVTVLAGELNAACPDDAEVAAFLEDYRALKPTKGFGPELSMSDAECAQAKVVRRLSESLGPVVGYKAGLTNPAMQALWGVDHPLRGVLLKDMLVETGAELPAKFGTLPMWEADFIVEVKNPEGLLRARTLREAAHALAYAIPFMELPDQVLDPKGKVTGPVLVATNTGARMGVLGQRIQMQTSDAFIAALGNMTVVLFEDGRELARGPGTAIMAHPLNAAMWIAQDLDRSGMHLKTGDLLSLGTFLPMQLPKAGTTATVRYVGLPGDPSVTVRFK